MTEVSARAGGPLSVARVLQILDALSKSDVPLSLAKLSRQLGVPKTSLIGLLRGLADANFIAFSDGNYRLGGSAFDLASAMMSSRQRLHLSDNIRTGMRELNRRTNETVLYAILNQDDPNTITYLDIVESRGAIRISVTVGDRSPLYCTAGGRVLLADMPDEEVRDYLDRAPLAPLNSLTVTDKTALFELIRQARIDDFSSLRDEMIQGVTGIASAVRHGSGRALGALIIAGPTTRMLEHDEELAIVVREAAQAISLSLGYRAESVTA